MKRKQSSRQSSSIPLSVCLWPGMRPPGTWWCVSVGAGATCYEAPAPGWPQAPSDDGAPTPGTRGPGVTGGQDGACDIQGSGARVWTRDLASTWHLQAVSLLRRENVCLKAWFSFGEAVGRFWCLTYRETLCRYVTKDRKETKRSTFCRFVYGI